MPKGDPLCTWCAGAIAVETSTQQRDDPKRRNKDKPCKYCDRPTKHRQSEGS